MGIFYHVAPLEPEVRDWLESQSIECPDGTSRWPTRGELRAVLDAFRGFEVRFTENGPGHRWDAFVSDGKHDGNWTLLHAEPQHNSDDITHLYFEKGEPTLIVAILRALSAVTGPFMLLADVGGPPMVVSKSRLIENTLADHFTIDPASERWQTLLASAPEAALVDSEEAQSR